MSTIKEIAEHARVSIGTVDRVLHKRGNVSAEARERVLKAIEKLDYKPNIFARQLKLARPHVFGVIMPRFEQDSGYWVIPARGIDQAEQELAGHRVSVRYFHYNRYNRNSFSRCCEKALAEELNGYLMAPALPEVAREFEEALPQNTPCVYFDSTVPESRGLCSIVQDSYASGVLAGRLMHLLTGTRGLVAVMQGHTGDYHIQQRLSGFTDYYRREKLNSPLLIDPSRNDDHADRQNVIMNIIREHPGLKGLFISDAATYCAARALEALGEAGNIHIIGYDLLPENIQYLQQGTIDFLISQQSKQQGYQGIYSLFRYVVLKEQLPETVMMPIDIITRENVQYYQTD